MIETIVLFTTVMLICYMLAYHADKTHRRKESNVCIALIIIVLSFVAGFRRYDIGIDTPNYVSYFLYGFRNYQGIEIGYKYLSNFLMSINSNYTFGLTCISLITNTLFITRLWSLRDVSPFRYSFSVYYCMIYLLTFSGIRQWLAVSIVFFATKYVYEKRNLIVAFILVVIAFFLHNSVVISLLLLIPYMFEKGGSLRKKLFKFLIFVLAPIAGSAAYSLLMSNYSKFLTDYARSTVSVGIMIPVRAVVLLLMFYFDYPRTYKSDTSNSNEAIAIRNKIDIKKLLLFELIDLLLNSMGFFASNTSRICWYYLAFTPLLYGYSLSKKIGNNTFYVIIKIVVFVIFTYYLFTSITSQTNHIVPYHFYWDRF